MYHTLIINVAFWKPRQQVFHSIWMHPMLTGGYVVILTSKKNIEPFEPSMDRLVQEGAWRMLNRKLVSDYLKGEDALLYLFKKSF